MPNQMNQTKSILTKNKPDAKPTQPDNGQQDWRVTNQTRLNPLLPPNQTKPTCHGHRGGRGWGAGCRSDAACRTSGTPACRTRALGRGSRRAGSRWWTGARCARAGRRGRADPAIPSAPTHSWTRTGPVFRGGLFVDFTSTFFPPGGKKVSPRLAS